MGARVALLRSPILPTARRTIPERAVPVQPRTTRGESRSSRRSDKVQTADVSTAAKVRTFLLRGDSAATRGLTKRFGHEKLAPGGEEGVAISLSEGSTDG